MRLAFVIPQGDSSACGPNRERLDRESQQLCECVAPQFDSTLFSERSRAAGGRDRRVVRAIEELEPRRYDRILYLVANDPACAFMLPWIGKSGGNVLLLDWELGRAARACWPEIDETGWRGFLRAAMVGGLAAARQRLVGDPPLNRPVVRLADGFIVRRPELAERIRYERNAPTAIACLDEETLRDAGESPEVFYRDLFERLPAHPAVRRPLIQNAIEGADRARRARARAAGDGIRRGEAG